MKIELTKEELKALIRRSSLHTGIADSKVFMKAYQKLLKAWCDARGTGAPKEEKSRSAELMLSSRRLRVGMRRMCSRIGKR